MSMWINFVDTLIGFYIISLPLPSTSPIGSRRQRARSHFGVTHNPPNNILKTFRMMPEQRCYKNVINYDGILGLQAKPWIIKNLMQTERRMEITQPPTLRKCPPVFLCFQLPNSFLKSSIHCN